jgi:hypothetical protein
MQWGKLPEPCWYQSWWFSFVSGSCETAEVVYMESNNARRSSLRFPLVRPRPKGQPGGRRIGTSASLYFSISMK